MTANGRALAAAGSVTLLGWLSLGYPALLAVAVVCALLLTSGAWVLFRRGPVDVTVTCAATRIPRDSPAIVTVTADRPLTVRLRVASAVHEVPSGDWTSDPLPRGRHPIQVEHVVIGDWLALWRRRRPVVNGRASITVTPRRLDLAPPPESLDPEQDGRQGPGPSPVGAVFAGLRAYEPGDDVRRIDWSASARTPGDDLFVRQFAPAVADDPTIHLDTYRPPGVHHEAFENAVDIAWSLTPDPEALIDVEPTDTPGLDPPATVVITVASRPRPPGGLLLVVGEDPEPAWAAWNAWARR